MSELTIYQTLRLGGLSPAGACAMMGNMSAESGLISFRKQGDLDYKNGYPQSQQYTGAVDDGSMTRWQFMSDSIGYGLCQWTYSTRKDHLYMYARELGVSIGQEQMQCGFCIYELQSEYAELFSYLCNTNDLVEATKRICAEYECPAVNNFADRINVAQRIYNQFGESGCTDDACPIETPAEPITEPAEVTVRTLRRGDLGRDVFLLQCGLNDMNFSCGVPDGDFGTNTEAAVMELQEKIGTQLTGVADQTIWQTVLNAR